MLVDTPTLFTVGYQLRDLNEFIDILLEAEISHVIDVRDNAWSYKKGFSKTAFSEGLNDVDISYIHAKYVGNPKSLRDNADSHRACLLDYRDYLQANPGLIERFNDQISPLIEIGANPCLVCYERHPMDCHRHIISDTWRNLFVPSARIKHLAPEGADRFTNLQIGELVPH